MKRILEPLFWFIMIVLGFAAWANAADARSFGARGDGITDDTAALQAAIDSGDRLLYIQNGTYRVSGLRVTKPMFIIGEGSPTTLIRAMDASSVLLDVQLPITDTTDKVEQFIIQNLKLQGGAIGLRLASSTNLWASSSRITNVHFRDSRVGIHIVTASAVHIRDSIFWGSHDTEIVIENQLHWDAGDYLIEGNFFVALAKEATKAREAILHLSGSGLRLHGNKFLFYPVGYRARPSAPLMSTIQISGNSFDHTTEAGVSLEPEGRMLLVSIQANQFVNAAGYAVFARRTDRLMLEGNNIIPCSGCNEVRLLDCNLVRQTY